MDKPVQVKVTIEAMAEGDVGPMTASYTASGDAIYPTIDEAFWRSYTELIGRALEHTARRENRPVNGKPVDWKEVKAKMTSKAATADQPALVG
jgi:hypothetical protein